ncbi:MAG: DUF401 family protein [Bacillota bacterium]
MGATKLLIVFAIILILLWRKFPLAPVMVGSSLLLALLYLTTPPELLRIIWDATKSPDTIEIASVLILIMVLERLLREQGYLDRMLDALTGLFKDRRIVMGLLPAFIGLMPSAGGALFSAPLVEKAVGERVSAENKAFINFYYRHIWEFFLPIYPGILLASAITKIPLPKMILGLLPMGLLMILIGIPFLAAVKVEEDQNTANKTLKADKGQLLRDAVSSTLPVFLVVGLVLASVGPALAVAIVLLGLAIKHRYTPIKFLALARKAIVPKTIAIIWGIMFFKETMTATGSLAALPEFLGSLPIPEIAVVGLLSFLIAYLTGQTGFYVGIAFPLVVAAVGGNVNLPTAVFVFISGTAGTMLSPMHLCLTLTIDYFKAEFNKVLKKLVFLESIMVLTALVVYLIFK